MKSGENSNAKIQKLTGVYGGGLVNLWKYRIGDSSSFLALDGADLHCTIYFVGGAAASTIEYKDGKFC